ncbi:MAG TPA: hypothetical protein VNS22_27035 [Geminicoccus sp.]|nr:hypothetical protein [Geminicoccus sp.]HWL72016.1 hypothetical protein [Geminicoccus sp.]
MINKTLAWLFAAAMVLGLAACDPAYNRDHMTYGPTSEGSS